MPRRYGKILTRIWSDKDFAALSSAAQRMYLLLLSQPGVNMAGVIAYTPTRWATLAADTSRIDIDNAIGELGKARFVIVDEQTEELLIRTYIRNDDIWASPNMLIGAMGNAVDILSTGLRAEVRAELASIDLSLIAGWKPDTVKRIETLITEGIDALTKPFG